MASFAVRFTTYVIAGAVVGMIAGIILEMTGAIDNPFWGLAGGILVGAVAVGIATALREETTRE